MVKLVPTIRITRGRMLGGGSCFDCPCGVWRYSSGDVPHVAPRRRRRVAGPLMDSLVRSWDRVGGTMCESAPPSTAPVALQSRVIHRTERGGAWRGQGEGGGNPPRLSPGGVERGRGQGLHSQINGYTVNSMASQSNQWLHNHINGHPVKSTATRSNQWLHSRVNG